MKKIFTLIYVFFFISFLSKAQLINEGFESASPPPVGWDYYSVNHSTNNPRTGSRDLVFNGKNDYVITPLLVNPGNLSFWYRTSTNNADWSLKIEVLDKYNQVIATLTGISLTSRQTTYKEYTADLSSYVNVKVRLTDTRPSGAHERYVDDFLVWEDSTAKIVLSRDTVGIMSYEVGSGPSLVDSFNVLGAFLSPTNDSVLIHTATALFEISDNPIGPFSTDLYIPYVDRVETKVYVRLSAALPVGSYNSSLTVSGGGATSRSSMLMGTVFPKPACSTSIFSAFSVYPSSGPPGTQIRITKSTAASTGNFSQVKVVSFGSVVADTFTIINEDTIYAIVPPGVVGNKIRLIDSLGCYKNSSNNFTFLAKTGDCGPQYSDLIISEIHDPMSGDYHYIEVFNGTNETVDLTADNYNLRVVNIPPGTVSTAAITGVIFPGEVKVYYAGTNGGLSTGTQSGTLKGFNENDQITLRKGTTTIDQFIAPNTTRYNYRRKTDVDGPASTYSSSDWNSITPTSTTDIGSFIPDEVVSVDSNPSDQYDCEVDMQVVASGAGTINYQWYYNVNYNPTKYTAITATMAQSWIQLTDGTTLIPNTTIAGATTNHLQITGDMSELAHSQFYCKITSDYCTVYSNAAQFDVYYAPYYRSKKSGDWRYAENWESSTTGAPGTWAQACTFPWDTNSVEVHILDGHDISIPEDGDITPDVLIGSLIIDHGGSLILDPNAELNISNNSGTDLTILGTLYDKGNTGSRNGTWFRHFATWGLGVDGTLIKAGASSTSRYVDTYEGGIATIPSTAHWIYRKETAQNFNPTSIDMFYPNLYFENISGASWSPYLAGKNGFTTVKGNLTLRGLDAVTLIDTNSNVIPFTILGNLNIDSNNALRLYPVSGAGVGTGVNLAGDLTNNGAMYANRVNTFLRLNGSGLQTISGKGIFEIGRLELDKMSQTIAQLNTDLEVKIQLNFLSGGIVRTNNQVLDVSNGDPTNAITGFDLPNGTGVYSDDKYIIGNLKRAMNTSNSTYIFPVGVAPSDIGYNPTTLTVKNLPATNKYATGTFVHAFPGLINVYRTFDCLGSTKFLDYDKLTNQGFWKYESPATFVDYTVHIHPNILNLDVYPNDNLPTGYTRSYRALKEDTSKIGKVWDPNVSTLGNPCDVSYNYYDIVGSGYTGFSIFAPGGGEFPSTALPIELLYFEQTCSPKPTLKWATASEQNSRYFTLEKSRDALFFEKIIDIHAAGQSSTKREYSYELNESDQATYYKLVETDLDGSLHEYPIITNTCNPNTRPEVRVTYHPGVGINIYSKEKIPSKILIFDAAGRFIASPVEILGENTMVDTEQVANGVYFISVIFGNDDVMTKQVIVY